MTNTFKILVLLFVCVIFTTRCSDDQEVKQTPAPKTVALKFDVNGTEKIVNATAVYDESLKRIKLVSDEIVEIEAIHETTKQLIYVYALKAKQDGTGRTELYEIKTGYYGYSQQTGCYYYGTLYVGDNGQSIFVEASGINGILNSPICPGGIIV